MTLNFLGLVYTVIILSILSGCVPTDGDPLIENMPPEVVNLPEPPTGYSSLTSMDQGSTVVAVNGQPVSKSNFITASNSRAPSRVILEPGYRCLTFYPKNIGGMFIGKRIGCFDVLRSHKYRAAENKNDFVPIIFDEGTARPVLAKTLRGPEVEGSARLIWSNLDGTTRHRLSLLPGISLGSAWQGDTALDPVREGSSKDQQVFKVKAGLHTFTFSLVQKMSLLADPIIIWQRVSFNISPGQTLRIVSGERGVYLLDANTNTVLRSPK